MKATFDTTIKVKVDKSNGIVHLSISPTEYKVEVFKVSLDDMSTMITSFSSQLHDKDKASHNGIKSVITGPEDDITEKEENNNN